MKRILHLFLCSIISVFLTNVAIGQQQNQEQTEADIVIPGELIVRMHAGMDPIQIIRELPPEFELKINRVLSKRTDIWLLNFNHDFISIDKILPYVKKVESVWLAQPNTKVNLRSTPDDPNFGNQWQHSNINSEDAWDITTGGTTATGDDIVVCIIESADVMGHPDLQDNHWVNSDEIPNNGIDDDNNGYVDDYNGWNVGTENDNIGTGGHGTMVAGMIGAKGNNNQGVSGANWDVKMMVIAGYNNPFNQANIVEAYTYPLEARTLWNQTNGAEGSFVVSTNASWGIDGANPEDYPIWCSFYDDLGQAGILNCGATSNSSVDVDQVGDMPTACLSDYMVSVTATDDNDQITFAAYGDETINVAAPGDGIYTTSQGGGYGYTQGTSFASPLTAGVIGLMYSIPCQNFMTFVKADPQGAADMVREALYNGVDQTPDLINKTVSGGRINAKNSIDSLMVQVSPNASFNASPSFLNTIFSNTSINSDNYEWDFGDGNTSTDENPSHTYQNNGTYNVCLTSYSDCSESTVCQEVTVDENDASINQNEASYGIVVYPNPAKDLINFDIESTDASEIIIYDPAGKIVSSKKVTEKTTTIDLHKFNTGLYIYQVRDIEGKIVHVNKISVIK